MEDVQPNEVRLSRKGSTVIPRVRTTRPVHASYRGQSFLHRAPSSNGPRWQPPATRGSLPTLSNSSAEKASGQELVEIHLPLECQIGAPGSRKARRRWIEDQKHYLRTNRHLSVVSVEYLDRDRSVLFTCRTLPATQSTGHRARDSIETGSYLDGIIRQGSMARYDHSDLTQSSEPGPSRIRPTPQAPTGLGGYSQRLDNQSSIPSSGYSIERKFVESSTTRTKSRPVHTIHNNPVPRHQASMHTAPPTHIIDLTLDPPGPVAEENSARWSNFRSGCVDICLPSWSSDLRVSSSEASTDPRPTASEMPAQVVERREDMPVVPGSNTSLRSAQPNIHAGDAILVRSTGDHRMGGSLSNRHRQPDVLEASCSSYSRDYSAEVLPSPPNHSLLDRGFTFACGNLSLPLGSHDKPRRVLRDDNFAYVVTAHGVIDQVDATSVLKLDRNIGSPCVPLEEFVDDACILSHQGELAIILGHAREQNQIAFLNLGYGQASRRTTLRRDWNKAKKPGVSAMTSLMSPLKFASGGYDHRVHLWDIAQDLSGASAVELAIKHTSVIHSLLPIMNTSHKLVSVGADRDVHVYDMSAERVVQTLKTSCIPYHAHKTDSPFCTLLEVSHLETQFEVRDHRMPNQAAIQRFGFIAEERRGRFEKADTWSHFTACGDKNGAVHLWDLRNVSTEVAFRSCFSDPVIQVVNAGPRLLACSRRNELACIDLQGGEEAI